MRFGSLVDDGAVEDPLGFVTPNSKHTKLLSGLLFNNELKSESARCGTKGTGLLQMMQLTEREQKLMYESFLRGAMDGSNSISTSTVHRIDGAPQKMDQGGVMENLLNTKLRHASTESKVQAASDHVDSWGFGSPTVLMSQPGVEFSLSEKERALLTQALESSSQEIIGEVAETFSTQMRAHMEMQLGKGRRVAHEQSSPPTASSSYTDQVLMPTNTILEDSKPRLVFFYIFGQRDVLQCGPFPMSLTHHNSFTNSMDVSSESALANWLANGDDLSSMSLSMKNMSLEDTQGHTSLESKSVERRALDSVDARILEALDAKRIATVVQN